jgi:long-chain acyl-CoA synthetase
MTRTNSHMESLTASILNHARRSWLFPLAWRHKQAALADGSMSKDTFFDKQVFQAARLQALGALANSLREIAVAGPCSSPFLPGVLTFNCNVGPLDTSVQIPVQIALSVPVSHIHLHLLSTSALFASHPYDLQIMSADESSRRVGWHYGPPTTNVEIKLTSVDEGAVEQGRDPEGLVRLQALKYAVKNGH